MTSLATIEAEARAALAEASTADAIEQWRVRFLGRKSALADLLGTMGTLTPEERRSFGQQANAVKQALEAALTERREAAKESELAASLERDRVDITMPGRPVRIGGLHPITKMIREVGEIFTQMGFDIASGPEVEWDHYNFEALNIPRGHPARDLHDTFWFTSELDEKAMLLRTHTSPMQVRIMEQTPPPVRVVVPGRVYRYEATDATHESVFHQLEGLAVDEGITMADLKGTLLTFARRLFGPDRNIRLRCDYFPFVEPGVEVAVSWPSESGEERWMEVAGAGMVHPNVLRAAGVDPDRYTGFAFGFGIERLLMLKHGIDDIRLFHGNDLRFLRQFN